MDAVSVMQLEESEDEYVQAERRINSLKSSLEEREKELSTAAQKLQEALSTSAASDTTIKQLEDAVQRYLPTHVIQIYIWVFSRYHTYKH